LAARVTQSWGGKSVLSIEVSKGKAKIILRGFGESLETGR